MMRKSRGTEGWAGCAARLTLEPLGGGALSQDPAPHDCDLLSVGPTALGAACPALVLLDGVTVQFMKTDREAFRN